ncbi:MAG: hypothetical protein V7609_1623 [Verrucomicrobiota bacterium]
MPTIHVARDGAKLGTFSLEEIREGLRTGKFLASDLGWQSGMTDWRPLSEFAVEQSVGAPGAGSTSGPTPLAVSGVTSIPGAGAGLPWEHRQQVGFFKAFVETVSLLLTRPSEAFVMMKTEGGLVDPLLFGLIGGSAGAIVSFCFQFLMRGLPGFGSQSNPAIEMFGMGWMIFFLLLTPIGLALGIFIGSAILHLCLMLVGGANKSFETSFRVVCFSCGAAYLFSMIPICGGLITLIYNIVLEIIGVARAHETTTGKAVLAVFLPLVICCGVFIILGVLIGGSGVFSEYLKQIR